ncbi:MAG: branched-chain amino acid transaminase [Bacteroidetes Order II. Incertae sedis bacterium]|jgi:branched-chain amino acid aminotransferase|nr:branched-chain amino acid transaminase [Bacteroidetes Order II. bacterium]MDG1754208.1 branched-chain amino acid transaminase [Rhodothermales bacterium]HAY35479.1 branched chain amino acid aminotransferase [Bacteroidota bacterium]MBT4052394.1 branched-chain amino acid transaminase [Bacteroidetes Order II. bacterium]MBT4602119.1 branched-chain amino acid transaminase [Bacteroidetes Order II. bacterium]
MSNPDIWKNGEFVAFEDATVHVLTHALHYGTSVFEGVRCYNTAKGSAIFRHAEHMQRLIDSARIYRMDLGYSQEELEQAVIDTIVRSGLKECYIRPLSYRGHGAMGVNPYNNPVETIIAVWKWGAYLGPEALENGVDVHVASWNRMAPNTFPSLAKAGGNYLNAGLVKMDAVLSGFTEGIMLSTSGHVAEGSGENLFLVKDGKLFTAPVSLSILPGITRDSICTLARDMGLSVEEALIPREALYIADEVFFTGTAAEVTPIRSIDHHTIGSGKRGEITERLQSAYFDILHNGNDPYGWLTPVPVG